MYQAVRSPAVFAAVALLAWGCSEPTAPAGKRVVGILEWIQDAPRASLAALPETDPGATVLVAPDTVQAGVPFTATVTTIGPSICWKADGAEVRAEAAAAVVTPYDLTAESEEVACGSALVTLPREVELRFTQRGQAVIRVTGRKVVGQDIQGGSQVTVEKRVHVR
ncbi:MAG TPA: hypothetical protein VGR37_14015 [Longimicrobiaceae bacterium]|nr:hypothetical protein [Longimicrobiaceae bacterium]